MSTGMRERAPPQVGDPMPDGTIYAGVSPDSGTPMYTTPADAPLKMKWKQAVEYAADLHAHGYQDWRLPTKAELDMLFNNRAIIGGFDETGSFPFGWYWSSTELPAKPVIAWVQRFSDGNRGWLWKDRDGSVRLVHTEPPQVGDPMPDGTIYAGVSPDTGKAMYTTAADAPLTYTFNQAGAYAAALDAHGHKDWRVPTRSELNVLFNNRTAIGGFDTAWHWSASQEYGGAWALCFSDGSQDCSHKIVASSLRCVR